jgi:hypothetical protein
MKLVSTFVIAVAVVTQLPSSARAFFTFPAVSGKSGPFSKSSPQSDAAVALFLETFPPNRPTIKGSRVGLPISDVDGTPVFAINSTGKRLTDIPEANVRANFSALATLYGPEQALAMVQALPIALTFNSKWFGPSLKAFAEKFGTERAKAMVARNPGLLALKLSDAATVNDQTMVFSYLVGYTRPLGPVLLPLLLFFLFAPAIEVTTGIPVRSSFLAIFQ